MAQKSKTQRQVGKAFPNFRTATVIRQRFRELAGVGVAFRGVVRRRFTHDIPQLFRRRVLRNRVDFARFRSLDQFGQRRFSRPFARRDAGQNLVQNRAQGKNVGAKVDRLPAILLRSRERQRSGDVSRRALRRDKRKAPVAKVNFVVLSEHNVRRLYIAVRDAGGAVRVSGYRRDFQQNRQIFVATFAVERPRAPRFAGNETFDQNRRLVRVSVRRRVRPEERRNVRVIQKPLRFRLLREIQPNAFSFFDRLFQREPPPGFHLRKRENPLLRPLGEQFLNDVIRRRRRAVRQLDANANPVARARLVSAGNVAAFVAEKPIPTAIFVRRFPSLTQLPQRRRRFAAIRVAQLERQIAERLLELARRRFVEVAFQLGRQSVDERALLFFR